jgi:hypothetical protein
MQQFTPVYWSLGYHSYKNTFVQHPDHPQCEYRCIVAKNNFLRNRSFFIMAKYKIEGFSATVVEAVGKQLPNGRSFKELVISTLENNSTLGKDEQPFIYDQHPI